MNEQAPKYLGNFAACEPWAAQSMTCYECNVSWTGCWDNFQCPKCGKGDLPTSLQPERIAHTDQLLKQTVYDAALTVLETKWPMPTTVILATKIADAVMVSLAEGKSK